MSQIFFVYESIFYVNLLGTGNKNCCQKRSNDLKQFFNVVVLKNFFRTAKSVIRKRPLSRLKEKVHVFTYRWPIKFRYNFLRTLLLSISLRLYEWFLQTVSYASKKLRDLNTNRWSFLIVGDTLPFHFLFWSLTCLTLNVLKYW